MNSLLASSASGFDYLDDYSPTETPSSDNTFADVTSEPVWPSERLEITFEISAETAGSRWFQRALSDLHDLLQMGSNWNGYGEQVVHTSSAKRLIHILDRMGYRGPPVSIVPLSSGGLQMEWHKGESSVEVEIPPTGDAAGWFFDDEVDEQADWTVSSSEGLKCLDAYVKRIVGT